METTPMTPVSDRHHEILGNAKGKTPTALRDWLLTAAPPITRDENVLGSDAQAPTQPMSAEVADSCLSVVGSGTPQALSAIGTNPEADLQASVESDDHGGIKKSREFPPLEYMKNWLLNARQTPPNDPLHALSADEHSHNCDLDPETGNLLPPVEYPRTMRSTEKQEDENVAWREVMVSSSTHIQRAIEGLSSVKEETAQAKMGETASPYPEDQGAPFAECIIRPAKPSDFAKIAAIINLEVSTTHCPQIFEGRQIVADDIFPIFRHCQNTLRPFVVAVPAKDEFLDPCKWPSGSGRVYEQFKKFRESQSVEEDTSVYGFAFIGEPQIGFLNRPCQGARHSGLIRMVVHPNHRRQLIGSALLERMLTLIDSAHHQMVDYHWEGDNSESIYERSAARNTRQYSQVYIELFTSRKGDENYEWKSKLLDDFSFKCIARFNDMAKTDRAEDNQWLDLTIWEHKIKKGSKLPHVRASEYFAPNLVSS
ncbi:unnamed protein product [Clonostachys rosea f. rosea IK726]|jgi:GNAT superfamily N-acetyltransferase|uniref:N-acetyltransferase domain-containing protein n=2 Tax=Bionectria ochroleuca TaxID=29856 RepID=A0A8H7NQ57_BIOOC|nr:unnamed protein product [Clonostachys rosea f. rosea IK726]